MAILLNLVKSTPNPGYGGVMCHETVELLTGTLFCSRYPQMMLVNRLLLLEFFRIASLHTIGVLGIRRKSLDPLRARLIPPWSFAVGSSSY